jgi:hypothetical protein
MSLNNSIKASEKCDLFRRLGQQFLLLSGQIENDNEITDNDFNIIAIKYENLVNDVLFEDIPDRYKKQVAESFKDRSKKKNYFNGEVFLKKTLQTIP